MPSIKVAVPHKLGTDEAKRRITHLVSESKEQFNGMVSDVRENWNGDTGDFSFRAMGFDVSGTMQVQPSDVLLELKLPFAALPFKGKVEQELTTRAKALLA